MCGVLFSHSTINNKVHIIFVVYLHHSQIGDIRVKQFPPPKQVTDSNEVLDSMSSHDYNRRHCIQSRCKLTIEYAEI